MSAIIVNFQTLGKSQVESSIIVNLLRKVSLNQPIRTQEEVNNLH